MSKKEPQPLLPSATPCTLQLKILPIARGILIFKTITEIFSPIAQGVAGQKYAELFLMKKSSTSDFPECRAKLIILCFLLNFTIASSPLKYYKSIYLGMEKPQVKLKQAVNLET